MKNDYDIGATPKITKIQAIQRKFRQVHELPDDDRDIGHSWLETLLEHAETFDIDQYLGECGAFARIVKHARVDKWNKRAIAKLNQLQQG